MEAGLVSSKQERWLIASLLLATLAHILDFVLMMPLSPILMKDFGITAAQVGHLVSVYAIAAAVSSFLSSFWIDRINRKRSLILLLLGFSVGNLMCAFATKVFLLATGRVVAGIFGGVINSVVLSIIGQVISIHHRGRASGLIGMGFPLVSILGVPASLALAEIYGWRIAFFLVLLVSFIALALSWFSVPNIEVQGKSSSLFGPLKYLSANRDFRFSVLLMILTVFGGFTLVPYIAPFLINNRYIESSELSLIYFIGGICSILASRIVGNYTDKLGKIVMLRWMLLGTVIIVAVFTNLPHISLLFVIFVLSTTMIFLPARFVCVMGFFTTIAEERTRGSFMSLISTIQQLTLGVATLIGGGLISESTDGSITNYWQVGIFAIIANLIVFTMSPKLEQIERAALQKNT